MSLSRGRLAAAAPWAGLLLVVAWTFRPHPFWLLGVAVAVVPGIAVRPSGPSGGPMALVGRMILLALVASGLWIHGRDGNLARDFEGYWSARESQAFALIDAELTDLFDRGTSAATTLARAAGGSNPLSHDDLRRLRREAGLAALALYGPDGTLVVWDGDHRGRVPDPVRLGDVDYHFDERPLASYLYLTMPVQDGGTAVGAALLSGDLPSPRSGGADFVSRIRERTGEEVRVSSAARATDGEVFDLRWDGRTLFSVSVTRPRSSERRRMLLDEGRRLLALGASAALGCLAVGTAGAGAGGAIAGGLALALFLPVDILPGLERLASPADVLVPMPAWWPGDLTLARLLLLLAVAAVAAGTLGPGRWPRPRPVAALALAALGMPAIVAVLHGGTSVGFLTGVEGHWLAYLLVMAGFLSMASWLVLVWARTGGRRRVRVAAGTTLAGVLALGGAWLATRDPGLHLWWLPLWVVPLAMLRVAGPRRDRFGQGLTWAVALVVGTSAALPQAWGSRLEARLLQAEAEVARLGTGVDPYLQFLLERMATTVDALAGRGASPVELLYRSWRESGMAEEGYPLWLTLWSSGDLPQEELRIGFGSRDRPVVADAYLDEVRGADTVQVRRFEHADAHYLMLVPLDGGRVVSAVVPPLQGSVRANSLLGPLFGSLGQDREDPLTLIPLLPGEEATRRDGLEWIRSRGAWFGEMALRYPGAAYHAHYEVRLPGMPVLVARGFLILAGVGLVLGALWALGRALAGGEGGLRALLRLTVSSFRARVTLALFGFFSLSNLIFGGLAYRTIDGAAQRAARVLSERAVNDAAATYLEVQGEVRLLARRVGADLLEYRAGALRDGSVEELVTLGLYEGWVPFEVHRALADRESLLEVSTTELGSWEYVTAYRRLPDGDVLGAPVPLQAGALAVQSREIAHLLGFAILGGAGLSLLLALLVGRTLARPIQTLKIASERVGAGNLGVRLRQERPDEFGAVFEAFNRMVRRLRRARRELVRATRRTRAVVQDVATGVVALDAEGSVTLANPRARELLGLPLREGYRPDPTPGVGGEFVRWVELYFRDGLQEASTEFQEGARRLRARARRIGGSGGAPGGAVVSLEDVTDELRTERVLAWGEMARQVAHEVKNPLTPIKLSVQHVRRAWEDRRPDFDEILTRNADAMLREIDRLAGIASGFARFGAPEAGDGLPLEPVALHDVVREAMGLYEAGEGPVRFVNRVPLGLPRVVSRPQELKEVLVNLLENARAAVHEAGTVVVEAGPDPEAPESQVVLRVVDDGVGIPASVLPRIFEPHFSTRSTGTGLGLAIVQRLTEGWGGTVSAESVPGQATILSVHMRLWAGPAQGGGGFDGKDSTS